MSGCSCGLELPILFTVLGFDERVVVFDFKDWVFVVGCSTCHVYFTQFNRKLNVVPLSSMRLRVAVLM